MRKSFLFLTLAVLIPLMGFGKVQKAQAIEEITIYTDQLKLKLPIDPNDTFDPNLPEAPGEEEEPPPEEEPPADEEPPVMDEYTTDANDFLSLAHGGPLWLNIDGLVAKSIEEATVLKFELTPIEGGTPIDLIFGILSPAPGSYDIRFPEYDPNVYRLTLKVPLAQETRNYELRPNSRIVWSADFLEMVMFDGDTLPAPPGTPMTHVPINDARIRVVTAIDGRVNVEARVRPDEFTPPEVPTPEPQPQPNPPPIVVTPDNPSNGTDIPIGGNNTGGPTLPEGAITDAYISGGGVGCSLGSTSADNAFLGGWILLVLGLSAGFLYRLKRTGQRR